MAAQWPPPPHDHTQQQLSVITTVHAGITSGPGPTPNPTHANNSATTTVSSHMNSMNSSSYVASKPSPFGSQAPPTANIFQQTPPNQIAPSSPQFSELTSNQHPGTVSHPPHLQGVSNTPGHQVNSISRPPQGAQNSNLQAAAAAAAAVVAHAAATATATATAHATAQLKSNENLHNFPMNPSLHGHPSQTPSQVQQAQQSSHNMMSPQQQPQAQAANMQQQQQQHPQVCYIYRNYSISFLPTSDYHHLPYAHNNLYGKFNISTYCFTSSTTGAIGCRGFKY